MGFVQPMPVQEEVIPYLLGNRNDVIALAQTGTGKTAAFGIPGIATHCRETTSAAGRDRTRHSTGSRAGADARAVPADCRRHARLCQIPGRHPHRGRLWRCIDKNQQIRALRKGVQVVVATPGRLIDLMKRGVAQLDDVQNVVLDEADEMLNMGFQESIDFILEGVPENRNTLLFSATMSRDIESALPGDTCTTTRKLWWAAARGCRERQPHLLHGAGQRQVPGTEAHRRLLPTHLCHYLLSYEN